MRRLLASLMLAVTLTGCRTFTTTTGGLGMEDDTGRYTLRIEAEWWHLYDCHLEDC